MFSSEYWQRQAALCLHWAAVACDPEASVRLKRMASLYIAEAIKSHPLADREEPEGREPTVLTPPLVPPDDGHEAT